jgi:Na+-driven multidrug efflux pump
MGIASAKALAWSTAIMAILNALLNYTFIFGHFGFPAMGMTGSAIGSAIAECVGMLYLFFYSIKSSETKNFELFKYRGPNIPLLWQMLKLSLPIMLQHFLSISSWLAFFLFIEKMGERPLAISNTIRSLYMLLMLPGWGYNMAASTIVSNLIGQGRKEQVLLALKKTLILSGLTAIVLGSMIMIAPGYWIAIFRNDADLIKETIPVLYVIIGSLVVFSLSWVCFGAVEGTGNTQMTLLFEVLTLCCYLTSTYYLVIVLSASIVVVWTVEYVYLSILGILCLLYLLSGRWKTLKL